MKKFALLLLVTAFAAAPAAAATKHKKAAPKPEENVFQKQNDNTLRILKDGMPLVLPSWSLPVYFGMQKQEEPAKKPHKVAKKSAKKKKM